MPSLPDLSTLTVQDLLRLDGAVIAELRTRDLVRTNNKPLGDIAEQIMFLARGGTREPNSTKSHDIIDRSGLAIQVKALTLPRNGRSGAFSAFRSFSFDLAVFLVFAPSTFDLTNA